MSYQIGLGILKAAQDYKTKNPVQGNLLAESRRLYPDDKNLQKRFVVAARGLYELTATGSLSEQAQSRIGRALDQ